MDFSSKLLEQAVDEMSQLPGIGKRTALRLVLHLLKQPEEQTSNLTKSLLNANMISSIFPALTFSTSDFIVNWEGPIPSIGLILPPKTW